MPSYTDLARVPIPLRSEADDISAILKACFDAVDPLLVLRAEDEADLRARYTKAKAGTVVAGTDQTVIWMKTVDDWTEIWSDTGVLRDGIVKGTTDTTVGTQWGRARSGHVSLYAEFVWTGASFGNSSGDIANKRLGYGLGKFRPPYAAFGSYGVSGWNGSAFISSADAAIWIKDSLPGATVETGTTLAVNFEFAER